MMSTLEQQLRDSIEVEMAIEALEEAKDVHALGFAWMLHCDDKQGEARDILLKSYKLRLRKMGVLFP